MLRGEQLPEQWESRRPLARFPRGSWKACEACCSAFHAFHSQGISTALCRFVAVSGYPCPASFFRLLFFSR